ncbi:ABC transporter substrate-binding protein [Acutalibacter caecimuris]|uniref:ABC transporter substrate-binding protein n=1 Tax=Acutalibacter caecimuris TaxID=3093657 RepID=UPI002AC95151|nr:ABC transporter substrate-binding protein [Acutalibacter sp. M00118]
MKKLIAFCLALMLGLSTLTGCSNGENSSASSTGGASSAGSSSTSEEPSSAATQEEPYEINFAYLVASVGPNMDKVRAAVNELAVEELNMTVNLIPMTFSEFQSQLPMRLAASEPMDLMPLGIGMGATYIASQYIVDVSPYLDMVPNVKQYVGGLMEGGYIGDFLTGFPIVKEAGYPLGLAVRKDIFEELKYSVDDFHVTTEDMRSFDQITELFAAVKTAHPEMTVLDGTCIMGTQVTSSFVDGLGDGFGVLGNYGQETTVTNVYESDLFRDFCEIGKSWYDAGYASQDIAVNTDSGEVKMKAGNTFSIMLAYKPNTIQEKIAQTGYELEIIPLGSRMASNAGITIYSVANASKDPKKAVEFFNWCYGSSEFADLINWGIEGEDWVELEDGTAGYPEGIDAHNVGYHQDMGWMYPNQFAGHLWEGNPADILDKYQEFNSGAQQSKAMGFTFDSTDFATETAQLTSVRDKYLKDLSFGVVEDIDASLKALNGELYVAGLEKVMAAKQEQFDAWLAEQ